MSMRTKPSFALVWWLSLAQLITWGSSFYGFALFMGPMEQHLHLTRSESSLAFSLALLCEGLMAFVVGRWIDKGYAKQVMTWGSACVGLAFLVHRWVDSSFAFYALWMLIGAGWSATLYNPAFTVLTQHYPHDFRRAIITMTFLGGLASTVFIPLVAFLESSLGWRDALTVLAVLNLLICVPLHAWILKEIQPPSHHASNQNSKQSLQQHLKQAPFWLLGTFIVLMMAATSALPPHMVSLLRESGMNNAWAIAVPASIGVLQVLGRLVLYFLNDRVPVHQANRWVPWLIPSAFAMLLIGYGQHSFAIAFVVLYGVGNGLLTIVKGTAMAEYVSREHNGALNGILGIPLALSRALSPWLLGLLWQQEIGYRYGLMLMVCVCTVAIVCMLLAQKISLQKNL